uniref:Uncharacterized protein n=1 Tax=Leersia perrieri TaxID=77586 RepID=A0A0D9WLA4_9ORYZ
MAAPIQVVSSLQDIAHVLEAMHIDAIDRADEVQFELGEQTSLSEAVNIKSRTGPGRDGFVLVNHELLACKFRTKVKLEAAFNRMVDASLRRINEEPGPIEVRTADPQMTANNGPPLAKRGQGPRQCIYANPPFPDEFSFEHNNAHHRVSYKHPYATRELRDEAAARDRRGQRALWEVKLRVLEVRQSILKERKTEMVLRMKEEYDRMMEDEDGGGMRPSGLYRSFAALCAYHPSVIIN